MMLVDKETGKGYVEVADRTCEHKEYASNAVGNTALGLSIGALAWNLLGGNCNGNGLLGNVLGCNNNVAATQIAENQYIERKECADYLAITEKFYQGQLADQAARFADRQTLNKEFFDLYAFTRNGFDAITTKHNEDAFKLYKEGRDNKDALSAEIGELRTELAVMKATRPYQDALIQCDIRRVAEHADFNLWRRTCRMIEGQVVLPNTPTVTGFGSYNGCCSHPRTSTGATA